MNQYLVTWDDDRNDWESWNWPYNRDIYGAFIDQDGNKIPVANSENDSTFAICTADSMQWYAAVSWNMHEDRFLVVWSDYRNTVKVNGYSTNNMDIYGQLVSSTGELLQSGDLSVVPPDVNMFICNNPQYDQDVPDVAWSSMTNQWLVVFGWGGWGAMFPSIWGQRVDNKGRLRMVDGQIGMEPFQISYPTTPKQIVFNNQSSNGPSQSRSRIQHVAKSFDEYESICTDGLQPSVSFNNSLMAVTLKANAPIPPVCEAMVVWADRRSSIDYYQIYDVYGQRVALFPDADAVDWGLKDTPTADSLFFATLMDSAGMPGQPPWPNYPVGNAYDDQAIPELDYNPVNGEWLVAFPDGRNGWDDQGIYAQRLYVAEDTSLHRLGDDGITEIQPWENIPIDTSGNANHDRVGVAFSPVTGEFLVSYSYTDTTRSWMSDIYAKRYFGDFPDTDVPDSPDDNPFQFTMDQNYPNPFNPSTEIAYTLTSSQDVNLVVYDVSGRHVKTLVQAEQAVGPHMILWDGTNVLGDQVASGVYLYRIETEGMHQTRRMILIH
ncbi:T9SS type A sorting domain-containing protein [candidate division KSB1 bacterium]|nr:T9SS type A sorting domain-containing protein [candidate division KSB1 bacterium]